MTLAVSNKNKQEAENFKLKADCNVILKNVLFLPESRRRSLEE